ncbi:MAG TPA: LLM class F420-dependent oxidoreductase [Ktedonobacterales bacterium]|nr:LLM class F420-dependent oxidoreductase [Ktedonobacterales bacterium]
MTTASSSRRIRIGVQMQPQHTTYPDYIEAVRRFEAMGVDTLWNWDHFFPLSGDPQGNHFEGWTLLTAMAANTARVEIGCLVTCNTYRNPALLANMAKTVDHISNGRLIFGLGAGWFERDYQEYGYEFGTAGSRLAALERSLEIIKQRWEVDVPKPLRQIPIMVGGGGEQKTLRIAARHATMTHFFADVPTFTHKMGVLDQWCAEFQRDPTEIERACSAGRKASDAERDDYVAAGASHFILGMSGTWDYQAVEDLLRWRDTRNQAAG